MRIASRPHKPLKFPRPVAFSFLRSLRSLGAFRSFNSVSSLKSLLSL